LTLATYSALVVKSNFGNLWSINLCLGYAPVCSVSASACENLLSHDARHQTTVNLWVTSNAIGLNVIMSCTDECTETRIWSAEGTVRDEHASTTVLPVAYSIHTYVELNSKRICFNCATTQIELMWANAQCHGHPPNIAGALCSTLQSLADAHY